ncbi:MAG: hypothetical protein ACTS80_00785 [Candidatus Hodgkinia cicadicola]
MLTKFVCHLLTMSFNAFGEQTVKIMLKRLVNPSSSQSEEIVHSNAR